MLKNTAVVPDFTVVRAKDNDSWEAQEAIPMHKHPKKAGPPIG